MISAFEILKSRPFGDKPDLISIEQFLNIELPPIYKIFLETFKTGDSNIKWEEFINPSHNYPTPSGSIKFAPVEKERELFFSGFFSLEEMMQDWEIYSKNSEEWLKYGMLRIGYIGTGGGLFLGIKKEIKEGIYRIVWDWNEAPEKLADNIFEFVKGLIFVVDSSNMKNYHYSQFHKKWGDDFWQI